MCTWCSLVVQVYQSSTSGTNVPVWHRWDRCTSLFKNILDTFEIIYSSKASKTFISRLAGRHRSSFIESASAEFQARRMPCSITIINPTHQEYLCAPLQLSNVHLIDHSHQGEDQPGPSSSAPQSQLGVPMTNLCVSPPCGSLCEPHPNS